MCGFSQQHHLVSWVPGGFPQTPIPNFPFILVFLSFFFLDVPKLYFPFAFCSSRHFTVTASFECTPPPPKNRFVPPRQEPPPFTAFTYAPHADFFLFKFTLPRTILLCPYTPFTSVFFPRDTLMWVFVFNFPLHCKIALGSLSPFYSFFCVDAAFPPLVRFNKTHREKFPLPLFNHPFSTELRSPTKKDSPLLTDSRPRL